MQWCFQNIVLQWKDRGKHSGHFLKFHGPDNLIQTMNGFCCDSLKCNPKYLNSENQLCHNNKNQKTAPAVFVFFFNFTLTSATFMVRWTTTAVVAIIRNRGCCNQRKQNRHHHRLALRFMFDGLGTTSWKLCKKSVTIMCKTIQSETNCFGFVYTMYIEYIYWISISLF